MNNKEVLLKKLSHKENILELMGEYGNRDLMKQSDLYEEQCKISWTCLNTADICSRNKMISVYYAIISPYLKKIRCAMDKETAVKKESNAIMKSIEIYFMQQVSVLSDSVMKCSMKKYMEMTSVLEEEAEERFVQALKSDYKMNMSVYKSFSYWTESLYHFLESTALYLTEVFENLENEYAQIKSQIYEKDFEIRNICLESGDRHNDKFVLKFDTSLGDLYYKPRNNDIEVCLEKIVNLAMQYSEKLKDIKFPKAYSKGEHQWVKAVCFEPLKDKQKEENYYYRMGEILAFYYILDGNDLHFENIISSGEYPVLIDVETLFTGRMLLKRKSETDYLNSDENNYGITSVKDIGIIPHYIKTGNISVDISSINFQTDEAEIKKNHKYNIDKSNLHKACRYISQNKLEEAVCQGFAEVYRVFLEKKEEMASHIFKLVNHLKVRFLKHPTNEYAKLKQIMMKPICFHDYDYAFAVSARVYGEKNTPEQLELCEQKDLLALNIPRFEVYVKDKDIIWNDETVIKNYFTESAWECVKGKIDYLCKTDYENQTEIIHKMFQSVKGLGLKETGEYIDEYMDGYTDEYTDEYMEDTGICENAENDKAAQIMNINAEYEEIINEIICNTRRNPMTEEPFWIGYQLLGEEYQVVNLPNSYYSGLIGVISILLKDEKYRNSDYFKKTVSIFLERLPDKAEKFDEYVLTGVYDGIGMYIKIVQELYDYEVIKIDDYKKYLQVLLKKCRKAAVNDRKHDILNGNAGLLLALMAVLETAKDTEIVSEVRKTIELVQEALISHIKIRNGECYFPADGFAEVFFTGYGHGSSGIIMALYKSMKIMGNMNRQMIENLLLTERRYYDREAGVWYKDNRRNASSWGWCHGIPGILLSRIELFKNGYRDKIITNEIHELIELSIKKGFGHNTTFCHGDMALITIIEYAYEILENDREYAYILEYKEVFIKEILLKRKERNTRGMESIGLMDGLLGIAYFLKCRLKNVLPIDVLTVQSERKIVLN